MTGSGGKRPAPPPEVEDMPMPSPAPMPVEAEQMDAAKKGVRNRAAMARGRSSTILAGRMMDERNNVVLSKKLGQNYGS